MSTTVSKGVVLAAGEGSRMAPLDTPKPLLPAQGTPLIKHAMSIVDPVVDEFVVVGNQVSAASFDRDVTIVSQPDDQYGTAGAVGAARHLISGPFMALNGDIWGEPITSLDGVEPTTVWTHPPAAYGRVEDGQVVEDSAAAPINAGVYLLSDDVFDRIWNLDPSPRGEYELPDALPTTVQTASLDRWRSFEHPWDLIDVGDSVRIHPDATVHDDALITGGTYIGPGCRIGARAEIHSSILVRDVTMLHHGYIGHSVIGAGVNLGAGTTTANLRHDERAVAVDGTTTGRRKMGAVIGPSVKTGCGTVLNPGATLAPGTTTYPNEVVE